MAVTSVGGSQSVCEYEKLIYQMKGRYDELMSMISILTMNW